MTYMAVVDFFIKSGAIYYRFLCVQYRKIGQKTLYICQKYVMVDFYVMLVLKTVIYHSKLLGFQNCASLELEHYSSDT